MIKVEIIKEVEVIKQVTVDGHADYAEHGSDIVCAGVSAVVFGLINAVDALDEDVQFDISANEDVTGHLTYRSLKSTDKEQLLLNAMLVALKTIEENYSDYITIEVREVKLT
jgi:ribosome associated protein